MPRCVLCKQEKSNAWFERSDGSFANSCHLCEAAKVRFSAFGNPTVVAFKKPEVEPRKCQTCAMLGHSCRVCRLIEDFRSKQAEKVVVEVVVVEKRLEDIPLTAVEKTKEEKYTIQCERCEKRHDPNKVRVVGSVCQYCWSPAEYADFMKEFKTWQRPRANPAPARQMAMAR